MNIHSGTKSLPDVTLSEVADTPRYCGPMDEHDWAARDRYAASIAPDPFMVPGWETMEPPF